MKYQVIFENRFGAERIIGFAENFRKANQIISKFCEDRNYRIPYVRYWVEDGRFVQDAGSHVEFFYIARDDGEEITMEEYLKEISRKEVPCHF